MKKNDDVFAQMKAFDRIGGLLVEVAPSVSACGERFSVCDLAENGEPHFCCAAHKILNPVAEAPLSFRHFSEVLSNYGIKAGVRERKAAHRFYVHLGVVDGNLEALDSADQRVCELDDELEALAGSGGATAEVESELIDRLNAAGRESERLLWAMKDESEALVEKLQDAKTSSE